jgi:hypothetical protein
MKCQLRTLGILAAVLSGCATADGIDPIDDNALEVGQLVATTPPSGTLADRVVEISNSGGLLDAVSHNDNVYIHDQAAGAWYYKSGNYLLGVEAFTQFKQALDRWIDFGTGGSVAPMQARIVGESPDGAGWNIPSLGNGGQWPVSANSAWMIGTNDGGRFGMGGAPQGIPLGTEVFGSMQTYGGTLSTPFLYLDGSTKDDSTRIRARFAFHANTLLGGHSAGASTARRIALDVGLDHVWLYGTPNYARGSGAYVETDHNGSHTMVAEVINNHKDPVTHVLATPWNLVSLAWGTATCHNYSHWDYQQTTPETVTCP